MITLVCLCLVTQGQVDTVYSYRTAGTQMTEITQEIVKTSTKTLSRKTFTNNTEMVFSSDEAERLFRGEEVMRHDVSILTSVFPLPQTKRPFVYYVVEDGEVIERGGISDPETNMGVFIFWIVIPCLLILLFGFFTPQESRNKLLVFYGALITTTVLGMVVGYSAGVVAGLLAGAIAGGIAGAITGANTGAITGAFAGAITGADTGAIAGLFTGTSDIWVVSQYLVILVVACILSYLLFMWKDWWKERKQLRVV